MDYPLQKPRKTKVKIVKFTDDELRAAQEKAYIHTNGNFSQWVRKAVISYNPDADQKTSQSKG